MDQFEDIVHTMGLCTDYWKPMEREEKLNRLRRTIAELVQNDTMDPSSLLSDLTSTNWDEWQNEVKQFNQTQFTDGWLVSCKHCSHNMPKSSVRNYGNCEIAICTSCRQRYDEARHLDLNTPRPCSVCNGAHTPLELVEVAIPSNRIDGEKIQVCPIDPDYQLEPYKVTCQICDSRYLPFRSKLLCERCRNGSGLIEWRRVKNQNSRAQSQGQAATLTIKQWLRTIDHFRQKCAYCQKRDYSDMEHYIPLPNAGTTVDNCLPSCQRCNLKKKSKLPDAFPEIFPVENLERITAYFETVKAS